LRQLGDPSLDGVGNFTLPLSPGLFVLTKRKALLRSGAVALDDSHSGVHVSWF
jgi:hypothetical protein